MRCAVVILGLVLTSASAWAGFSDRDAAAMASSSPAAGQAMQILETALRGLPEAQQAQTRDGLLVADSCVVYRTGEDEAVRRQVVSALMREGFATDEAAAARSLYGYPVRSDADCLHKSMPFLAATGGGETDHHAWPGGLAYHTAFNLLVAQDLLRRYRQFADTPQALDETDLTAAVLWHDWAKQLLYHWSDTGIVSYESSIAGTGAHHIIGLAEAMARNLPASQIAFQACAHHAPDGADDQAVVGYLRAAAIIARVDPVARGYLRRVGDGFAADNGPECRIDYLSDQNWVSAEPALRHARAVLIKLAVSLGYTSQARQKRFVWQALSYYGADRFDMIDERTAFDLLLQMQRNSAAGKTSGRVDSDEE